MDDGISIPPPPRGHDYAVKLLFKGISGIARRDDEVRDDPERPRIYRWLTVRGARCEHKARDHAQNRVGAGWSVVLAEPLHW